MSVCVCFLCCFFFLRSKKKVNYFDSMIFTRLPRCVNLHFLLIDNELEILFTYSLIPAPFVAFALFQLLYLFHSIIPHTSHIYRFTKRNEDCKWKRKHDTNLFYTIYKIIRINKKKLKVECYFLWNCNGFRLACGCDCSIEIFQ